MYRLHGVLLNVVGGVWCSVSDRPLEEVLVKNTLIYCSFSSLRAQHILDGECVEPGAEVLDKSFLV
jgi:hypothetical protein